jgi:hypothetical protein
MSKNVKTTQKHNTNIQFGVELDELNDSAWLRKIKNLKIFLNFK